MKILLLIWLGKIIALVSRILNLGAGSTWPGHIAYEVEPRILSSLTSQLQKGVILIAGTNGKTTTAKMIDQILRDMRGVGVIRNESGANLLNGMVSALIDESNWLGKIKADWAIFEVDEATLPLLISNIKYQISNRQIKNQKEQKLIVVLLNLFRDQLDRYGEVDQVADKWLKSLKELKEETTVILNADDPHIAYLGRNLKSRVVYFGLDDPRLFLGKMEHAVDSVYCPKCGEKLQFSGVYFSHLGIWSCLGCGSRRPHLDQSYWDYPLPGVYNRYNTLAAVLVAKEAGVEEKEIRKGLANFEPAFGRQEEFKMDSKKIRILLSKNPAGFNESLRTLKEFPGKKKTVLLVLNDRIPDGRDVSWIWDVDFEMIPNEVEIIVSGDRVYDIALRIKYSYQNKILNIKNKQSFSASKKYISKIKIYEDLREAINESLNSIDEEETLYILPTYSAMLEVRKIIRGRKLL